MADAAMKLIFQDSSLSLFWHCCNVVNLSSPQKGAGVPDDDFELLPLSKLVKEKQVKEKAVKVKGAARQRLPGLGGSRSGLGGIGRRIKEIEDPSVARKLSRFSSAPTTTKIEEEEKPNHLSTTAGESIGEKKVLPTKPSRFSSSRKSSRRPHIRMKIKEKDADSQEEEEKNSTPARLREKSSSGSFRRTSSPSTGRMKKPSVSGEEAGEPQSRQPVSRSRGRGRVREQDQSSEGSSQITSADETAVSSDDGNAETEKEEEEVVVSRGRVRKPPSLASVVRHRY